MNRFLSIPLAALIAAPLAAQTPAPAAPPKLPELNAPLRPLSPMKSPLRDLTPPHLDIFQAVLNTGTLEGVYDSTELTDLDAAQKLLELINRGYVEAGS